MASLGTASIDVEPDFEGTQNQVGSSAGFGGMGKKIGVGLGVAAAGFVVKEVVQGIGESITLAESANSLSAISASIIESTGGAAQITSAQLDDLNKTLSIKTGIDDELIRSGQNVLLTFTNIKNEVGEGNQVFDQASGIILDMATVFGGDATSAATQLGKALNDPIAGIGSLSRVGVQFTEQQKEQIKTLVESGDTLSAQKIILGELETQVGGTAEASADSSAKIANVFEELQESVGRAFLPLLDELADVVVNDLLPVFETSLFPIFEELGPLIAGLAGPIGQLIGAGLELVMKVVTPLIDPLLRLVDLFLVLLTPILDLAGALLDALMPILVVLIEVLIDVLEPILLVIADLFENGLGDALISVVGILEVLLPVIVLLGDILGVILPPILQALNQVLQLQAGLFSNLADMVARLAEFLLGGLASAVQAMFGFFSELPGRILGWLGNMGSLLYNVGVDLIRGFINGLKSMAGAIISAISSTITNALPGFVKRALGISSPSKLFMGFGAQVSQGMALGIQSEAGAIQEAADSLLPSVDLEAAIGGTGKKLITLGSGATTLVLAEGAVQVNNPLPEPASTSVPRELRKLATTLGRA